MYTFVEDFSCPFNDSVIIFQGDLCNTGSRIVGTISFQNFIHIHHALFSGSAVIVILSVVSFINL